MKKHKQMERYFARRLQVTLEKPYKLNLSTDDKMPIKIPTAFSLETHRKQC